MKIKFAKRSASEYEESLSSSHGSYSDNVIARV
jgi:hypothetical protein